MIGKKHLVVVCGQYYPYSSPTAKCAENYVLLCKDEYDIEIISESENGLESTVVLGNGVMSHTVSCTRLRLERQSKGIISKLVHLCGTVQLLTNYLGNQRWYRKAALEKLEQVHSERPIDVVFSICSPMAAICAGVDFKAKHPSVRLCSYTVDPYYSFDRVRPLMRSRRSLAEFEKQMLLLVDKALLSEEVYRSRPELRGQLPNCRPIPYLMPPLAVASEERCMSNPLTCVYAGSFYKKIRNPKFMLDVFSHISGKTAILHLYSKGCEKTITRCANGNSIVVHGFISSSQMEQVYSEADILVGVGNSVSDFLPSKTFEYISRKKAIVYFNYGGKDNEVLDKHPLALQLFDTMPMNNAVSELLAFFNRVIRETIDENTLASIYERYSAANVKDILIESFN